MTEILLLCGTALLAGIVDAIGGGGGLLTLPALLLAGLPPHLALGTNKGQSVFGSGAALLRFARSGQISGARARWMGPLGFAGSLLGASLLCFLRPEVLTPVIMVLLALAGLCLVILRPSTSPRPERVAVAAVVAFVIGAYDGFFGPGTGTFLIVAFTLFLGLSLPRASAEAKVVNFASNLAAVLLFSIQGSILWKVALPMAGAQLAGGWIGAHLTMKFGPRLVRGVLLAVVAALLLRLGWTLWR